MFESFTFWQWLGLLVAALLGVFCNLITLIDSSSELRNQLQDITNDLNSLTNDLSKDSFDHQCPDCNSPLILLRSLNKKQCSSCEYSEEWNLNPGQKSLISSNRGDRRHVQDRQDTRST